PNELAVDPAALERQVRLLLRRGYRGMRFADVTSPDGPPRRLAVTFDDGYRSIAEHALPVLGRLGVPGTVFVPTAHVGSPDPMSWPASKTPPPAPTPTSLACCPGGRPRGLLT